MTELLCFVFQFLQNSLHFQFTLLDISATLANLKLKLLRLPFQQKHGIASFVKIYPPFKYWICHNVRSKIYENSLE